MNKTTRNILLTVIFCLCIVFVIVLLYNAQHNMNHTERTAETKYDDILDTSFGISSNENIIECTVAELITSPEKYDGLKVRVKGVAEFEMESYVIFDSMEIYQTQKNEYLSPQRFNGVWIDINAEQMTEWNTDYTKLVEFSGNYTIIEGVFNKNKKGHLSRFPCTVEDVTYLHISSLLQ